MKHRIARGFSRSLRLVFILLTFCFIAFSLFQSLGRLTMTFLDKAQPVINSQLAAQGVEISGLAGRWRLMNPVLSIAKITFPAGQVTGLVAELDWFESLIRGHWTFAHLSVADFDLALEADGQGGWRLVGTTGKGPQLDFAGVLNQSDAVAFAGKVNFLADPDHTESVTLHWRGRNRGGRHHLALEARNADCTSDDCLLSVQYVVTDAIWPLQPALQKIWVRGQHFRVPELLSSGQALKLEALDVAGHSRGDEGGIRLQASLQWPKIRSELQASGLASAAGIAIEFNGLVRRPNAEPQLLPTIELRWDHRQLAFMTSDFMLATVADLVADVAPAESLLARWLPAVAPQGDVTGLRGFWLPAQKQLAYRANVDNVMLNPFKGMPGITRGRGELLGFEEGVRIDLKNQDMTLEFPNLFPERWQVESAAGSLLFWFGQGYLGMRGEALELVIGDTFNDTFNDDTRDQPLLMSQTDQPARSESVLPSPQITPRVRARGNFWLARPPEKEMGQIGLQASFDQASLAFARTLVPIRLPERLQNWLATAPQAATLQHGRVAIQSPSYKGAPAFSRRVVLQTGVQQGSVRYHPDWPIVTNFIGELQLSGTDLTVQAEQASSAGAKLDLSEVDILDRGAIARLRLRSRVDADDGLDFIRNSPLAKFFKFIDPGWHGKGNLQLRGHLEIPLKKDSGQAAAGDVIVEFDNADLNLANYRLPLENLSGQVNYKLPASVVAESITGELYGLPLSSSIHSARNSLSFEFEGKADPAGVFQLLQLRDPGFAEGVFNYHGNLRVDRNTDLNGAAVTDLLVQTDAVGVALNLFAPLSKAAQEVQPSQVNVRFRKNRKDIDFRYGIMHGRLQRVGERLSGVVGLSAAPPAGMPEDPLIQVAGSVAQLKLAEFAAGAGSGFPLPLQFEDFHIGRLMIGGQSLDDLMLSGDIRGKTFNLHLSGPSLLGNAVRDAEGLLTLDLDHLHLRSMARPDDNESTDPLAPQVVEPLPAIDFSVASLMFGERDFGSWEFQFRRKGEEVRLNKLVGQFRGVRLRGTEPVTWNLQTNRSRFVGSLEVGDLAAVLPEFGFAPSLTTDRGTMSGDLSWKGSPLNFDLLALQGDADVLAYQGRFLEVKAGNNPLLRVLSLVNFTTIAKRLSLDFSDVFGKGVSFDKLKTRIEFDQGVLKFVEPMVAEGSGSEIQLGGEVDMRTGALNNEMIVTLPVTKGLPWYAAYIAIANPLAGVGVLVGGQLLRKPLEQFSSAKYQLSGTLEEPNVKFISIFDNQMQQPQEPAPEKNDNLGSKSDGDSVPITRAEG